MAVTFDLFGTLIAVPAFPEPAVALERELGGRDVAVPEDWAAAYGETHVTAPPGAAVSLPVHVYAALRSRGIDPPFPVVRRAVVDAFDVEVTARPGARSVIRAARDRGPVGVLSNCSVPGLVRRSLDRSGLGSARFDAIVSSVACGWRKPHHGAFEAIAAELGIEVDRLVHVGDDPRTDGGIESLGGRALIVEGDLRHLRDRLEVATCRS